MNQHPLSNTGFRKPPLRFHYGRNAHSLMGITSPKWGEFLSTFEEQKIDGHETNRCMTSSSHHSLETQLNYLLSLGQIPASTLEWCIQNGYLDQNGKFNFSDRFSAILNGTTPSLGNSFDPVWNGIQQYGLLPERDFTYTNEQADSFMTMTAFWNDYYDRNQITQAMLDKAKMFNTLFEVKWNYLITQGLNKGIKSIWDFVTGNKGTQLIVIADALRTAPVHIGIPVCPTWNSGDVIYCGQTQAAHGVMLYGCNEDNSYEIFDQYNPASKRLSSDYFIPYAVLGTIRPLSKPIHVFTTDLHRWERNQEVLWLQKCLQYLKYMKAEPTGLYGRQTAQAVLSFQADNGISPVSESNFGPRSRAAMNRLFAH